MGGYTQPKRPDYESQQLLDLNQNEIQAKLGLSYDNARVINYQTQAVGGSNYKIWAETNNGQEFEAILSKDLPQENGKITVVRARIH